MSKKSKNETAETQVQDAVPAVRLSAHPRALAGIRRVRAWCGLIGFALVTLFSLHSGLLLPDAVLRGLMGGAVAYFAGWSIAIKLWKQVALAELEAARERHEAKVEELRRRAAEEAAARLAADAERRSAETGVLDIA